MPRKKTEGSVETAGTPGVIRVKKPRVKKVVEPEKVIETVVVYKTDPAVFDNMRLQIEESFNQQIDYETHGMRPSSYVRNVLNNMQDNVLRIIAKGKGA